MFWHVPTNRELYERGPTHWPRASAYFFSKGRPGRAGSDQPQSEMGRVGLSRAGTDRDRLGHRGRNVPQWSGLHRTANSVGTHLPTLRQS